MFKQYPRYKFVLALCDYLLLLGAWVAAILIRFWGVPMVDLLSRPLVRTQAALIVVYSVVWIVIFQHVNLYKHTILLCLAHWCFKIEIIYQCTDSASDLVMSKCSERDDSAPRILVGCPLL